MSLRITGLGEEIGAVIGLPWEQPLEQWPEDPNLAEKRGISRHVVRLVRADVSIFHFNLELKEVFPRAILLNGLDFTCFHISMVLIFTCFNSL